MNRRQRQRGGSSSRQIQVAGDLIVGVSESRAAEIAREQARIAIREFTAEASVTATKRIEDLDSRIVRELRGRGLLEAFSDPGFQILLRKTQLHGAATAEDADHELLSKLLAERAAQPTRPVHMIVTRAVEVVEQIDQKALLGLTGLWFVSRRFPGFPEPKIGLAASSDLASKLFVDELPEGASWLERLDLLDCVNYQPPGLQAMKGWTAITSDTCPGYICDGPSEHEAQSIRDKLASIRPGLTTWLVPHAFLPGHWRMNTISREAMLNDLREPLESIGQLEALASILSEARIDVQSSLAIDNMLAFIKSDLPGLETVRSWWDGLQGAIRMTPLGVAVAYANAKRFDHLVGIPPLPVLIENF